METISKPFGKSKYEWYRLKAPHVVLVSKAGHKHKIERGDKFGVRDATSKKGVKRVIVDMLGKNIVFSMKDIVADHLIKKAVKASVQVSAEKEKEEEKPVRYSTQQIKYILRSAAIACLDAAKTSTQAKKYINDFIGALLNQQPSWQNNIPILQKSTYQYYMKLRNTMKRLGTL